MTRIARRAITYPNPWPTPDPGGIVPFTGSNGLFGQQIPADPVLNPSSASMVTKFQNGITQGGGAVGINIFATGPARFVCDPTITPVRPVTVIRSSNQTVNMPVPVPVMYGAAQSGADYSMHIINSVTHECFEMYQFHVDANYNCSCQSLAYSTDYTAANGQAQIGALSNIANTCSASGLMYSGGMIKLLEAQSGVIEHALMFGYTGITGYVYPAQTTDNLGAGYSWALPYGTRFFFPASLDFTSYNLNPFALAVAKAIQKYGFFIGDYSGNVAVSCEGGYAWQKVTGVDPWSAILNGRASYQMLSSVPWSQLQVLATPSFSTPDGSSHNTVVTLSPSASLQSPSPLGSSFGSAIKSGKKLNSHGSASMTMPVTGMSTTAFTVELTIDITDSLSNEGCWFVQTNSFGFGCDGVYAMNDGSTYYQYLTAQFITGTGTGTAPSTIHAFKPSTNTTYHLELSWDGTTLRFFVNGTLYSSTGTSFTPDALTGSLSIGGTTGTVLEEFRYSNVVRHTASYTPATTPLGSDANTQVYLAMDAINEIL